VRAETARKTIGEKMILIGNVPTKTLLMETAENVVKDAQAAMQGGVDLLAPACG